MIHTRFRLTICLMLCLTLLASAQLQHIKPVSPNASPEAIALLELIQDVSGKGTFSGQHNFPISRDRNSKFAAEFIGKTPVVWSQDFGFASKEDKDSYLARPSIIEEAIRQHKNGAIITLCWHAVPPTANEPVTFQPLPGYDSTALASVQGKLLDKQFKDLLTPGTKVYKQWLKQVDEIASFLKQLQQAKIPVLWRPYHEMNGNWFWWGGRYEGKYTTAALYRQIFDRLVKYHKLNNLIWVWSIDRPSQPGREFKNYYPGNQYLDILSLDVYGNDFNKTYYDGLMDLSQGKPIALAEVGNPPAPEILQQQPNWAYWVVWSGMVRNTSQTEYEKITSDAHVVFTEDPLYEQAVNKYRTTCGLDPIVINRALDLNGTWMLNEYESVLKDAGPGGTPYKLDIKQKNTLLAIQSTSSVEWADDDVTEQLLQLDGSENHSKVFNDAPRIQITHWSPQHDSLFIDSKITFNFGGRSVDVTVQDVWFTKRRGHKLVMERTTQSPMGKRNATIVYDKK